MKTKTKPMQTRWLSGGLIVLALLLISMDMSQWLIPTAIGYSLLFGLFHVIYRRHARKQQEREMLKEAWLESKQKELEALLVNEFQGRTDVTTEELFAACAKWMPEQKLVPLDVDVHVVSATPKKLEVEVKLSGLL